MRDPELLRWLSQAADDVNRVETVAAERLQAMRDAMNGWPRSVSFDGDRVSTGDHSDPTKDAAFQTDRAALDREAFEDVIKALAAYAEKAHHLAARYSSRPATPSERTETLRDNEPKTFCVSCSRAKTSFGVPRAEPGWRRGRTAQSPWGVWLCRWCYDWNEATGRLPTKEELEDHHAGKRVFRPVPGGQRRRA